MATARPAPASRRPLPARPAGEGDCSGGPFNLVHLPGELAGASLMLSAVRSRQSWRPARQAGRGAVLVAACVLSGVGRDDARRTMY